MNTNITPQLDSQPTTTSSADDSHAQQHLTIPAITQAQATSTEPGGFDLEKYRLGQDFAAALNLKRPLSTVPVRKPNKTSFIRVRPDDGYRLATAVIEMKEDSETFLVDPSLWPHLATEPAFVPKLLVTCISRPGDVVFLWPLRLPAADGRLDPWSQSALGIATGIATTSWTRVQSNQHLKAYEALVAPASASWGDPVWPSIPFAEILKIAFKGRDIHELAHPVLRRLRGEL
ncbi:MAG: hypothetical protein WCT12_00995 [Verrucomicrobiota bacterium]